MKSNDDAQWLAALQRTLAKEQTHPGWLTYPQTLVKLNLSYGGTACQRLNQMVACGELECAEDYRQCKGDKWRKVRVFRLAR